MRSKLKYSARRAWQLLGKSKTYSSKVGEETITELLQLYLSQNKGRIVVKSYTKPQESKNGADWDWWFVNKARTEFLGIRIQAKTIEPVSEEYKYLHYLSGKRKASQANKLLKSSVQDGMVPLYALYTYWANTPNLAYKHERDSSYGISLVTMDNILALKKSKSHSGTYDTLQRVSPHLIPLHKLLDFVDPSKSLPQNIFSNIGKVLQPKKGMSSRTVARPGVSATAPSYVMQMLQCSNNLNTDEISVLMKADRTTVFIEE